MTQIGSFSDVVGRFRRNWTGYIREYRVFWVLTVLAAGADMASTIYIMLREGPQAEGHPVVRLISTVFGAVLGPILGKICQFLVVIVLTVFLRRQAVYIFVAVIILYAWAAWYNILGCHLYYPRLLELLERLRI